MDNEHEKIKRENMVKRANCRLSIPRHGVEAFAGEKRRQTNKRDQAEASNGSCHGYYFPVVIMEGIMKTEFHDSFDKSSMGDSLAGGRDCHRIRARLRYSEAPSVPGLGVSVESKATFVDGVFWRWDN
jgi:hypothetical protein